MNKKQLAKIAGIAGAVYGIAPQVVPYLPPQHQALVTSLLGIIGIIGAGFLKTPLNPAEPKK